MALALTALSPTRTGPEGGTLLALTGTFPLGVPLLVYIVPPAGAPVACLSGVSGSAHTFYATTTSLLSVYTPRLPINSATTVAVNIQNPATGEAATLGGLAVRPSHFKTGTYALRSVLPPTWATGPRTLATELALGLLPTVPSALAPQLLAGLTSTVGDELTSFGGCRITRLTAGTTIGQTTLALERTIDLPSPGKLLIDGVSYVYATAGDGQISGVTYKMGGVFVAGTKLAHNALAAAVDVSQTYSAVDIIRASLLVDTAVGRDLEALGRNLGVPRSPSVTNDSIYRGIIQALAYAPRGTVLALSQALDALLGPGTYALIEDLISAPNQATLRVALSTLPYTNTSFGKTYLMPAQVYQSTASEAAFVSSAPSARVTSVAPPLEAFVTNCRAALPTTQALAPQYPGDAGQLPWANPNESANSAISSAYGGCTQLSASGTCQWTHTVNMTPSGTWAFGALVAFPVGSSMPTGQNTLVMQVCDGRVVTLSFVASGSGWGITSNTTGLATSAPIPLGVPTEVTLSRVGRNNVQATLELRINGVLVGSSSYANAPGSPIAPSMLIGRPSGSSAAMQLKQLAVTVVDSTDFWTWGSAAQVTGPATLTLQSGSWSPGDVGKRVRVLGSSATNAQGGSNVCSATIAQVTSSTTASIAGVAAFGGQVNAAAPNVFVAGTFGTFTYPQDLGKQVVIASSAAGNNGTYTITNLYDVGTGRDLATFATSAGSTTNTCAVAGAAFTSESNLTWTLQPVLVNESGVPVELSDAGSLGAAVNGVYPVTLRGGALPTAGGRCRVEASTVLSAQVLAPPSATNAAAGSGYTYYPAYIDDPLALLNAYVKQVMPAGARLNVLTT